VLLVLSETESPLLTQQIVYTGITCPKKRVQIIKGEAVLSETIKNRKLQVGGS